MGDREIHQPYRTLDQEGVVPGQGQNTRQSGRWTPRIGADDWRAATPGNRSVTRPIAWHAIRFSIQADTDHEDQWSGNQQGLGNRRAPLRPGPRETGPSLAYSSIYWQLGPLFTWTESPELIFPSHAAGPEGGLEQPA